MKAKYLLRFDDITPGMNWDNYFQIKNVAENLGIKSILGVVPNNKDPKLNILKERSDFFDQVRQWKEEGDAIVQHGYEHIYHTSSSGLLKINNRSEFSGLSYTEQYEKLKAGKDILVKEGVWQPYFMAPAHSFDKNTLHALYDLDFVAITDGYGFYPYTIDGIICVPQLVSKPISFIPFGVQTICLHTNTMNPKSIDDFSKFLQEASDNFIDFESVLSIANKKLPFKKASFFLSKYFLKSSRSIRKAIS